MGYTGTPGITISQSHCFCLTFQDFREPLAAAGQDQVLWVRHGLHTGGVQVRGGGKSEVPGDGGCQTVK